MYWAKKYDSAKHIAEFKTVGGYVLCGKYGALLGNNYANENLPVCEKCQQIQNEKKQTSDRR